MEKHLIRKFVYNQDPNVNISTIGISFAFKDIILKSKKEVNLKLIDTTGQEKYRSLSKSYFKNADAVIFLFSLDIKDSLEKIKEWKKLFDENN